MKTILSQAAKAETAKAEGATTIPKGSRFQVESKRGASHWDEEIVWSCWRQQENRRQRSIRNIFGLCFLPHQLRRYPRAGHGNEDAFHRRRLCNFLILNALLPI